MSDIDPNEAMKFGRTILKSLKEPLETLNDVWYNIFGYRAKMSRAKHEHDVLVYKKELESEMEKIPESEIQDPILSILGPTLEASKYYIEEPLLRKLFAKLAAGSFDRRQNGKIHHSFVQFLTEMSSKDAKLLQYISGKRYIFQGADVPIETGTSMPIMNLTMSHGRESVNRYNNILPTVALKALSTDESPFTYRDGMISIDNLLRLNLVEVQNVKLKTWISQPSDKAFKDNPALTDIQDSRDENIKRLEKELEPDTVHTDEDGTTVIHTTISFRSKKETQDLIQTIKSMSPHKEILTLSLTTLGKAFCDACF